jgi:hypothetical protein
MRPLRQLLAISAAMTALTVHGTAARAQSGTPEHAGPDAPAGAPEGEPGAPASGTPADAATSTGDAPPAPVAPQRATLLHVPPGEARPAEPLRLVAVIEGAAAEPVLVARYRPLGDAGPFREVAFERSTAGGYYATVPADQVARPGLEYYIAGQDLEGVEVSHFASDGAPHSVRIEPELLDRLAAIDRARVAGRRDTVTLEVDGHNFGNRYDKRDYFVRGEARWTHHFFHRLYAITFGYGTIDGKTPADQSPVSMTVPKGARYGLSEVRLRFHPSVFVDARAMLGVNRDELEFGAASAIILGRPWRSSVQIGGELLRSMGPTGFVRLQWDTVPRFLMGASIVKTDLPAAALDDGLYLRYDVSYPLLDRLSVRASVSYGGRDGAARWGGGAGTALSF